MSQINFNGLKCIFIFIMFRLIVSESATHRNDVTHPLFITSNQMKFVRNEDRNKMHMAASSEIGNFLFLSAVRGRKRQRPQLGVLIDFNER